MSERIERSIRRRWVSQTGEVFFKRVEGIFEGACKENGKEINIFIKKSLIFYFKRRRVQKEKMILCKEMVL